MCCVDGVGGREQMETATRIAIRDAFLRAAQRAEQGENYRSASSLSPSAVSGDWMRVSSVAATSTSGFRDSCSWQ
eukprot:703734-Prorocentrum_minimum.AAC.1